MTMSAWIHPRVIWCVPLSGCNSAADQARKPKEGPETGEPRIVKSTNFILLHTKIGGRRVNSLFEGMNYFVGAERGKFDGSGGSSKLRIRLEGKSLVMNMAERE